MRGSKNRDLLTADSALALLVQKQPWGEVLIRKEMSVREKWDGQSALRQENSMEVVNLRNRSW